MSAGPRTVTDRTATGYAHTAKGALIAAAQISIRASRAAGRESWEPTLLHQFVADDNRDTLLQALRTSTAEADIPGTDWILIGFVDRFYGINRVQFEMVYRISSSESYHGIVYELIWRIDDWMMVAPLGGS
jgi:hypothetical protein